MPQIPGLVQAFRTSSTGPTSFTAITCPVAHVYLPNPTRSGNCLTVVLVTQTGPTGITVTDDAGNTWHTDGPDDTDTIQTLRLKVFYALNVTPSDHPHITITFTGADGNFVSAEVCEWYNVAAASALSGQNAAHLGTTPSNTWRPGSFTPTTSGCLIYHAAFCDNNIPSDYANAFAPDTGFSLITADLRDGTVSQYAVQPTAAAINPTITLGGGVTDDCINAAIALAPSTNPQGSPAPASQPHIARVIVVDEGNTGGTVKMHLPSRGNLLVAASIGFTNSSSNGNIAGITDNYGNIWQVAVAFQTGTGGFNQIWYVENAKTANDLLLSVTYSDNVNQQKSTVFLYDVENMETSGVLDCVASANGTQSVAGDLTPTVTINPSREGGLIVCCCGQATGTMRDAITTMSTNPWNSKEDGDESRFHEDNGWSHYFPVDRQPVVFGWHKSATQSNAWQATAASFRGKVLPPRKPLVHQQRRSA